MCGTGFAGADPQFVSDLLSRIPFTVPELQRRAFPGFVARLGTVAVAGAASLRAVCLARFMS
jgi:hypothetical protein